MYARKWKQTYSPAVAIASRKEIALKSTGTSREELVKSISATVLCNIKTYMSAYGVTNEESFVAMMRKLGGYNSMIQTVIGPEPVADNNGVMPTSNLWWIWSIKNELIQSIYEKVVFGLSKEQI